MIKKTLLISIIISVLLLSAFGCAKQTMNSEPTTQVAKDVETEPDFHAKKVPTKYEPVEPPAELEVEPEPVAVEMTEEEKALAVADDYISQMSGFKDQRGRDLQFQIPVHSGCEGCWIVDATFHRNMLYYPDKTEIVKISLYMKDWEVDRYDFS